MSPKRGGPGPNPPSAAGQAIEQRLAAIEANNRRLAAENAKFTRAVAELNDRDRDERHSQAFSRHLHGLRNSGGRGAACAFNDR